MPSLAVTKMHGTRNDFVVLDARTQAAGDLAEVARYLCDRRSGIGADGMLVLLPSHEADARMRVINADGSEAEMCGNGVRCAARFLSENGEGDSLRIETLAGEIHSEVLERGETYRIRVRLGVPQFEKRDMPFASAEFVRMGNPHIAVFDPILDADGLIAAAEGVQRLAAFREGVNVHAVRVTGPHRIQVVPWERGVGLTAACGTGSAACAAAAIARNLVQSPVDVGVPGGLLRVEWDGGDAYLTGPAVRVFDARVDVPSAVAV